MKEPKKYKNTQCQRFRNGDVSDSVAYVPSILYGLLVFCFSILAGQSTLEERFSSKLYDTTICVCIYVIDTDK